MISEVRVQQLWWKLCELKHLGRAAEELGLREKIKKAAVFSLHNFLHPSDSEHGSSGDGASENRPDTKYPKQHSGHPFLNTF